MRTTKAERRIMWGWVSGLGVPKGGNCAFACTRTAAGQYLVNVTEPGGLPVPCSVSLATIASNVTGTWAEHSSFPGQRQLGIQIRNTGGTLTDNDFYWTAVG